MADDPWAGFIEVTPRAAPRPKTLKEQNLGANTGQSEATTEKTLEDAETERLLRADKARKLKAEADAAEAAAAKAARETANGPALTGDKRGELKDTLTSLDQFESDLNLLEDSFTENFEEQGLATPREYLPDRLSGTNESYNAASQRLLPLVARALGFTSKQMDTPAEIARLGKYVPDSYDRDETAREKLTALRQMLDRQRENAQSQLGVKDDGDDETLVATGEAPPVLGGADGGTGPAPPSGPPLGSDPDPSYQAATGDTRTVADPKLQGQLDAMLRQGANFADINAFAVENGAEPINRQEYAAVRAFLRKNPNYKGSLVDVNKYVPLSAYEKTVTAIGDNPIGAYAMGAGQMLSGNTLDNLTSDPERARLAMDVNAAKNPTATAIGQVSGATLGALSGEAGLARLGMSGAGRMGLLRGALADTSMGAASGAGAADAGDRGLGALQGAGVALLGNAGGNVLGAGLRRTGTGVADPSVQALASEKMPLTVGQTYGNTKVMGVPVGSMVKGIEDRIEGLPAIGAMVRDRRIEGMDAFNAKAFDRALAPVGGSVKGKVGEEAVEEAQKIVSDAYTQALSGAVVQADKQFANDLTRSVTKVAGLKRVGPEVLEDVKATLEPYMNGTAVTGEAMQAIKRDLEAIKRNYRGDTRAHAVAGAVDEVKEAVFGMFRRQAPDVLPAYQKADAAYRRLSTLEDAVLAGKNTEGKFSPAQLGAADKAATKKFDGKRAAASGKGPFHDMQRDAQNVLPNKVPDSGTAGRVALGQSTLMDAAGLSLAGILGAAYTKAGQRLLTKPGRGVSNPALRKLLTDERTQQLLGRAGAGTGAALGLGTSPGQ